MTENRFPRCSELLHRALDSQSSERGFQTVYAPQSFEEVGFVSVARRDAQRGHASWPHQLRRNHEQALAQALQGSTFETPWSTEPFEPVQQVVGQQHDLEERFVGEKVFRRDF